MILLTGASGMLGSYIREEFKEERVLTLGRGKDNDFVGDLVLSDFNPDFGDKVFKTIIHCAGTEDEKEAENLNFEGTRRLLESLKNNKPEHFVHISSYKVYSETAGENVKEDDNLWPATETGKSKVRAEELLREWANNNDITLSIVRPAMMFGNGVKGKTLQLFNDAVDGKYIHIRGNDAKVSVVCAYDVARAIKKIYERGGVYNAADGFNPRLIELVESMTANAGGKKRMTHLPLAWAEWIWRLGRFIPSINRNLHPEVVENRMKTLTIDGTKLKEASGLEFFNTIDVIERTASGYPYKE